MKVNKLEKLSLDLYHETLDNGLNIYIVPKDNVNGIYATLSVKYGSINNEFVPYDSNKMQKFPLGIAHFLEHKVFEQENDKDPFEFYSERGCDANANTSNIKTTYLFSGASSFEDNIKYLLDYVQSPYFTDENVEKEKGIIEQEIKMYDDNPYMKLYNGIIYNSFIEHPIKYPIGGTVEDIRKITKEDLYTCYNTFYNPGNMFLVITGNVDVNETINIIKINQENKKYQKFTKVKEKEYDEPNKVAKEYDEFTMDIEIPKVGIAYKIDCSKYQDKIQDLKIYLNYILDLKLGPTSELYEALKNENLITSAIDYSVVETDKHLLAVVLFESNDYELVQEKIEKELNDLTILEEELNRKKKVSKSGCIYRSDSIYSVNSKIVSNIMRYGEVILDDYKKIDSVNIDEVNNIFSNLDLSNKSVYVIKKS